MGKFRGREKSTHSCSRSVLVVVDCWSILKKELESFPMITKCRESGILLNHRQTPTLDACIARYSQPESMLNTPLTHCLKSG